MTEDTYEYECMRAELLGIEKPSLDEYLSNRKERESAEQEDQEAENLKQAEEVNEDLKNVSGGLSELSGILSSTQRKLNRFKASCGSLTNLLKIKIGSAGSTESIVSSSNSKNGEEVGDCEGVDNASMSSSPKKQDHPSTANGQRKTDLARALDNHVDSLDLIIAKTESCQYSMEKQNNEMKKFLK